MKLVDVINQKNNPEAAVAAAKEASAACNVLTPDYDDMIRQIFEACDKNAIWHFCMAWCRTLSEQYHGQQFDGRNEYSTKVGSLLIPALCKEPFIPTVSELEFCDNFKRTHRTIQQSFSSLVFRMIRKIEAATGADQDVAALLNAGLFGFTGSQEDRELEIRKYYFRCPLI